jgi:hypothetical protein
LNSIRVGFLNTTIHSFYMNYINNKEISNENKVLSVPNCEKKIDLINAKAISCFKLQVNCDLLSDFQNSYTNKKIVIFISI